MSSNAENDLPGWDDLFKDKIASGDFDDGFPPLDDDSDEDMGSEYAMTMKDRVEQVINLRNEINVLDVSDLQCINYSCNLLDLCTYKLSLIQPQEMHGKRALFLGGEYALQTTQKAVAHRLVPQQELAARTNEIDRKLTGQHERFAAGLMNWAQDTRDTWICRLQARLLALRPDDTAAFDLGQQILLLAIGETVMVDGDEEVPAIDENAMIDVEAWKRMVFDCAAFALISMAKCLSALFGNQTVQLFGTRIPAAHFMEQ